MNIRCATVTLASARAGTATGTVRSGATTASEEKGRKVTATAAARRARALMPRTIGPLDENDEDQTVRSISATRNASSSDWTRLSRGSQTDS